MELLRCLYTDQAGFVEGERFDVRRGVRQGDILSPMLFNEALYSVGVRHEALACTSAYGWSLTESRATSVLIALRSRLALVREVSVRSGTHDGD